MAKIIIENAKVERVFHTQNGSTGVALVETWTPDNGGEPRRSWFTAWFKQDPSLQVGQVVSVSGFHSAKTRTYDSPSGPKTAVDVNVNAARLIDSAPPIAPAPSTDDLAWREPEPPTEDPWATSGGGWG